MIDKPIYRHLQHAVGEAHGSLAITIVLQELAVIFEQFADEIERLYDEDETDVYSMGYRLAANWCDNWAEEVTNSNG